VPFNGNPGKFNAITDVPGVEVGYSTIIRGSGKWTPGKGPVRTGVTVVLPFGKTNKYYSAGHFIFNGDGEVTGLAYLRDYGVNRSAIGITNTNSVGVVRDAIGEWNFKRYGSKIDPIDFAFGLPIVGETWDGDLNDINGYHVKRQHVFAAIESAKSGKIKEGNVGGGTAMSCLGFKCGTGTSSRIVTIGGINYTVGVLVQANFGLRGDLTIAGVPVGKKVVGHKMNFEIDLGNSLIAIVGTDAPLVSSQLDLVAKRVTIGMARTGAFGASGSGDIFVAFTTANSNYDKKTRISTERALSGSAINPIFRATVEATEESIINAMVAAKDMEGINGNKIYALPHDQLKAILRKYNRLENRPGGNKSRK
jgi:L-aminopeptidase/D-esterase-like protein